jgi:hypothetical protein
MYMSIFDRFTKKSQKTPITKVSLKYAETEREVHKELCHLAWQMTIGNASYSDAVKVIQEGKPFLVPQEKYAQLDVRDFRVYDSDKGRDHYWPDDEENTPAIALRKGKFLGCSYEGKNGVEDLVDRDDAHEFIERLEQLHKMYAEVESGKKLPKEEPKKEEESSDKKEKPETKAEEKQQETTEASEQKTSVAAHRPLYNLWSKLTDDGVAAKLQDMTRADREEFFNKLLAEYEAAIGEMKRYAADYQGGMAFYATAVRSFNLEKSSAAKFLKELEDEQKKTEKPQEEKTDDKSGGKKEDPNKDTKQKNFISRQKKKVNSWIRQAEAADDEDVLDVLDDMKIALDKGDIETYKKRQALYDRLMSAGQQTNHDDDSSTNSTGSDDQGSEQTSEESESNEENSEDDTSEEEATEDSDKKYPIKDVIAWMQMVGVTDIPFMLTMSSDQTKGISATWVNRHMESIGNDNRLVV